MNLNQIEKKLVNCQDSEEDFRNLSKEIADGWIIINIIPNGNNYLCILEKGTPRFNDKSEPILFIPPRKKIKIRTN